MYFITTLSSSPSSLASQSVQQAKTVFFGGKNLEIDELTQKSSDLLKVILGPLLVS